MTLCTDDLKTAGFSCRIVQLNIRTTTGHISSDRYCSMLTCLRYNLSFHLMKLGIQYIMLYTSSLQHTTQKFRYLDRDRTNQYRLSFGMCFFYCIADCSVFFLLRLIYSIIQILTDDRLIGRDFYNVHSVDLTELLLLCQRRTCHTALLFKFVEEILECNGRQRLTLTFHLYMFLRLNRLMQTIRITASRHDTSGKFIYDQYFIILNHIILVTEHQVMRTECQDNVMLDFQVLRISQIVQMEELLYLLHTIFCQVDVLFLLIYDKVSGFLNLFSHDGVDLRELSAGFTFFHLSCKNVTCFIKLR